MSDTVEEFEEFSKEETTSDLVYRRPQKNIRESKMSAETIATQKAVELDKKQARLIDVYKAEPKVSVRIAPSYAKYFGRAMRVTINGICVTVFCNGKEVELPKTFADEVFRRMSAMDEYENKQDAMSKVSNNYEVSPGQLSFF